MGSDTCGGWITPASVVGELSSEANFVRKLSFIVPILLLGLSSSTIGGEIRLSNDFFTGWEYSLDGLRYQSVGFTGSGLRREMVDNEAALKQMSKYKEKRIVSAVLGWPGGAMLGWSLGAYAATGEWTDSEKKMFMVGAPLTIFAVLLELSANANMKKAVRIYNGEEQALDLEVRFPAYYASKTGTLVIGMTWSF